MSESGSGTESSPKKVRRVLSFRLIASLATAGLIAATVLVVSRVNEQHLRTLLEREAESQLLLESRNLAMLSGDALLSDFPELTLVPLIKDIRGARPELELVVVVNHEEQIQGDVDPRTIGQIFNPGAELQPLTGRSYVRQGELLAGSPGLIVAQTPVVHRSKGALGRVVIALNRSFIEAKIHEARDRLIRIAAILLAGSTLITVMLMSFMLRPIGALREGLRRIGRGDLESPMQVRDRTELGALADSVNEMADQLKSSRALALAREKEIIDTQKEVITTLGDVVESRSLETANHTRRVGAMCRKLALIAGLDKKSAELIRLASPMHDVGKIGIPDSILNKPGKLTDYEYEIMKTHAIIGYGILAKSERPILKAAAIIAHEHHERWDGTGYPRRIAGENIHIFGRITSLVDVFDALFSDRCYRKAMSLERVLEIVTAGRGTQFDPRLVDLFLSNLKTFLAISEQYQDTPPSDAAAVTSQAQITELASVQTGAAPENADSNQVDELIDVVLNVTSGD